MAELIERLFGPKRTKVPRLVLDRVHARNDCLWANGKGAHTIFLVHQVDGEVTVAIVRMVDLVPVCELCEERAWVRGQRVKGQAVYGEEEGL